MTNKNKEKVVDVHLKEYEFVSSLIPMYRRFQMQAVSFSILVYTAVVSLIGATWVKEQESKFGVEVLHISIPMIPWFISTFLISFVMM
jgi:Mg2+/citrate symporter